MNGYELAALLRVKVTISNAMQAADKLEELEDLIYVMLANKTAEPAKKKTGKKNESKPSGNEDKTSFFAQREIPDNNGLESDLPRTEGQPDFNEPLLSDEIKVGN